MSENEDDSSINLDHLEFDGLSSLQIDAASMHEIFTALHGAGFTEDQALRLTAYLIVEGDGPSAPQPDVHEPEGMEVVFTFDPDLVDDDEEYEDDEDYDDEDYDEFEDPKEE